MTTCNAMRGRVPIAERGPGHSYRPDLTPPSIHGEHQTGIATAPLERIAFAAFDLEGPARPLLQSWSAEAQRLMDAELTLTFGLGAPALPAFPGDDLDPALCGGDVCVLAGSDDGGRASDAIERLASAAQVRWRVDGFLGPRDRPGGNPRDPLGFRHGTANVRRGLDFDRHVWTRSGGTFLVVRRIAIDLARWHALPLTEQERIVGRHRDTGAPLGARREYDGAPLPPDSHAGLAKRAGERLLRRAYAYDGGLLLLAYTNDPRRRFVPLQRRLAEHDPLSAFTTPVGSAVFAIPPGAPEGGFIGSGLAGFNAR
jgi:deferrochelatase/peroxidase EfeB